MIKNSILRYRRPLVVIVHFFLIILAYIISFYIRFEFSITPAHKLVILKTLPLLILVKLLLFYLPLPQTLLLVGIIHWFGDIWKILFFKKGFNWKLILTFGIAGMVASYLGASIIFSISEKLISQILGGFLIAYVLFLFLKPKFKIPNGTLNAKAQLTRFRPICKWTEPLN